MTGSLGLVGSAVVDACVGQGWDVVGVDRRNGQDVRSPDTITSLGRLDAIMHCGSPGNIHDIARDRVGATDDHCTGAVAVVEAAAAVGAHVVLSSTWEVYSGGPSPIAEATGETRPSHFYGALKLAAETAALAAAAEVGVRATALRIGSVWASRGRTDGVIPVFLDKATAGETLHVEGDAARQFIRAEDVANAFVLAVGRTTPPALNIVGDELVTIRQLAETVAAHFGVDVIDTASRDHDAPTLEIDAGLANKDLGWRPQLSFWEWLDREMPRR